METRNSVCHVLNFVNRAETKRGSKFLSEGILFLPRQESLQGKKMAGFENDLLSVKNDHNALAAKLDGILYLKVRVEVTIAPYMYICRYEYAVTY